MMKFSKEAWEAAPEGAWVELDTGIKDAQQWISVRLVGFRISGNPIIEVSDGSLKFPREDMLRIVLPKRKMTVQLWRTPDGREVTCIGIKRYADWTLLGEHTFEIEESDD